jgi:hypothetical protein
VGGNGGRQPSISPFNVVWNVWLRNQIIRILGFLLTALGIGYFIYVTVKNSASLPSLQWNFRTYSGVIVGVLLYTFGMGIAGYAWYLLLRSVKEPLSIVRSLTIHALAAIGKYIPGNVGQYIGRVALARRAGLQIPGVMLTLIIEAAWTILVAIVVGACVFVTVGDNRISVGRVAVWQFAVLAAVVVTAPFVGVLIIRDWRPGPIKRLLGTEDLAMPGFGAFCACFVLYMVLFLLMGVIMKVLGRQLFNVTAGSVWLLIGVNAIAWVVGFITPGSPGGIGVREAVLVASLAPIYGSGTAVGLSIALRVVTTLSDGLAFVIALVVNHLVPAAAENR